MKLPAFLARLNPSSGVENGLRGAPNEVADRHTIAQSLVDTYLTELDEALQTPGDGSETHLFNFLQLAASADDDLPGGRAILAADPEIQAAVVRAMVAWAFPPQAHFDDLKIYLAVRRGARLVSLLLSRKIAYEPDDIDWMLAHIAACNANWNLLEFSAVSIQSLLRSIHRCPAGQSLSAGARESLAAIRDGITRETYDSQGRKALELIAEMLGDEASWLVDPKDDWGHGAQQALDELTEPERSAWIELVKHVASLKATMPSQRWTARTRKLVAALGDDSARGLILDWLALLDRPSRDTTYLNDGSYIPMPSAMVAARNAEVLKGLIWASLAVADDTVTRALGDAALQCYRKIPDFGSRSTKAGNACVNVLAELATPGAIVQLLRLLQRVKLRSVRNHIEEALHEVANTRGMTREDLEELATPTFNLIDGVAHIEVGDYQAEIVVESGRDVTLRWLKPDGRAQKSVPAEVSREYPADLKAVKGTVKELKTALQQQPWRIEASYLRDRSWDLAAWRERYIDHPLVSLVARRLIWSFSQADRETVGAWLDGQLVGTDDAPLNWLNDEITVRLWHPIQSGVDEVLAWREWLERHAVTQPFKQAHREIYVLTDAERATETYSNRMAAHILRQHQFNALASQRGWQYNLQGGWDGHNVPSLALPGGLQAEFWVDAVDGDDSAFSHSYVYLFVTTDQVCFTRPGQAGQIPVEEIPPLVFSEVMRDIDLFVGVAGIGADPNWLDGGPGRMADYHGYWWDVSFGDLTAGARTRRDVLARLLPRMAKLEGRWELDDRFLKIRGDLRGYKIHLGSGNILMEPNDQYLCIVPGRGSGAGRAGNLYLPFEGDQTLSVILSKALMLADDIAITDPSITRQIVPA